MIQLRQLEIQIVEGLQAALGYPVIRANQTAPVPGYPYVSYTVTLPVIANNGTWGKGDGDIYAKPFNQVWSITAQSDDATESEVLALAAYEWLDLTGTAYLNENGVVVKRLENITNRDNLLTMEYEYRNGFDVRFSLMSVQEMDTGAVDGVTLQHKED